MPAVDDQPGMPAAHGSAGVAAALALALCRGGLMAGAVGGAVALGLLGGETMLAKARIPRSLCTPPTTHGSVWTAPRVDRRRRPVRVALLGDSMAAGFGVDHHEDTLAGQLGLRLSAQLGRPVRIANVAVVGARSRDLREQLRTLATQDGPGHPDLAVLVVGANDVTHRVPVEESVRHLALAVHALHLNGTAVVVGTCPDLGCVRPIAEPLRTIAHRRSRRLGRLQTVAVRRAGATAVPLYDELGLRFTTEPHLLGPDRFHPSAAGYALAADVLLPAALRALRQPSTGPVPLPVDRPAA